MIYFSHPDWTPTPHAPVGGQTGHKGQIKAPVTGKSQKRTKVMYLICIRHQLLECLLQIRFLGMYPSWKMY